MGAPLPGQGTYPRLCLWADVTLHRLDALTVALLRSYSRPPSQPQFLWMPVAPPTGNRSHWHELHPFSARLCCFNNKVNHLS